MNLQELQNSVSKIESVSNESYLRFFFMLKENDAKTSEYLDFLIKKDADFVSKFVELIEQETKKANRVLMTFNSLNEMNAFIKAGNECGASWFENDFVHCYCYKAAEDAEAVEVEKTLSESINMKFGTVENSHVMNVRLGVFNAYETLFLICSELNVDLKNVSDSDFYSCSIILENFCNNLNEETGTIISIWFD